MKVFTRISPPVINKRAQCHKEMLASALTWMNEELDRYIRITQEVPWFYNERAVLGFFISGLIRKGDALVLQEFSCYKDKNQNKKNPLGRADLYFKVNNVDYLVESKWCWTPANERSGFVKAVEWANEALSQANRYREDAKVEKKNVFSLCFEAISFTKDLNENYADTIKQWQCTQEKDLDGLDFYSLIEVTSNTREDWYYYDNLFFPALAVYGLFN